MDADGALDVRAGRVRRSRVVRAPRCWRYVGGKRSADNGGKRAVLREEHEVSRKAIAQVRMALLLNKRADIKPRS